MSAAAEKPEVLRGTEMVSMRTNVPEPFQPEDLVQARVLAEDIAKATVIPSHLRNRPADCYVILIYGRDLGLTPMQSLLNVDMVEGKPRVNAVTTVGLVKRSPLCQYFQLVESTDVVATFATHRKGDPKPTQMSYTLMQARDAGLYDATKKSSAWVRHTAVMLRRRCSQFLAKEVYPDVVGNMYDDDEIEEIRDAAAREVHIAPPPPSPPPAPRREGGPSPSMQAVLDREQARTVRENAMTKDLGPALGRTDQAPAAPPPAAGPKAPKVTPAQTDPQPAAPTTPRQQEGSRSEPAPTPGDFGPTNGPTPTPPLRKEERFDDLIQPPEDHRPIDAITAMMLEAGELLAEAGIRAARERLSAAAAQIPPLFKAGKVTAEERQAAVDVYRDVDKGIVAAEKAEAAAP